MSEALTFVHGFGARVEVLYSVVLALWGTITYFRNVRLSGGFRSSYLILAALAVIQGLVGLGALLAGGHPREGLLHMVYGVFAVLFLPGAYLYAHGGTQRRETAILAGACWIVTIAFLRGIGTA